MQFTIAVLALAGSAVVSAHEGHGHEKAVDPASASLALFGALPTPIANVAITNPAAAATLIQGEFATGTPTWFGKLPPDVQTYFLTAAGAAIPPAATTPATTPMGTGTGSTANSTATGKYNNGTTTAPTSTSGTSKLSTSAASTGASGARTTSSTGGASLPTGIVGAGIAGAAGLLAMIAL